MKTASEGIDFSNILNNAMSQSELSYKLSIQNNWNNCLVKLALVVNHENMESGQMVGKAVTTGVASNPELFFVFTLPKVLPL